MMLVESTVHVRTMTLDDLSDVLAIDRLSFPIPWSERSYRHELLSNPVSHLLVADDHCENHIALVGYVGFWFIVDEMHISTLAVHPRHRRMGIGTRLLAEALDRGREMGGVVATLEVRRSNQAAVRMYKNFGFEIVGRRANYYRDNSEDAWLMTLDPLEPIQAAAGGGGTWVRRRNSGQSPPR